MFNDADINKADKLFDDSEWQPPEDCKALVTLTQAGKYIRRRHKQNKFLLYYSLGITKKEAGEAVGINEATIYNWQNDPNSSFLSRVSQAGDYARKSAIANIHKHAQKDWRAAAWWLERKHAGEFGEVKKAQVDINVVGTLNINERKNIADRFLGLLDDADPFTVQAASADETKTVN